MNFLEGVKPLQDLQDVAVLEFLQMSTLEKCGEQRGQQALTILEAEAPKKYEVELANPTFTEPKSLVVGRLEFSRDQTQ